MAFLAWGQVAWPGQTHSIEVWPVLLAFYKGGGGPWFTKFWHQGGGLYKGGSLVEQALSQGGGASFGEMESLGGISAKNQHCRTCSPTPPVFFSASQINRCGRKSRLGAAKPTDSQDPWFACLSTPPKKDTVGTNAGRVGWVGGVKNPLGSHDPSSASLSAQAGEALDAGGGPVVGGHSSGVRPGREPFIGFRLSWFRLCVQKLSSSVAPIIFPFFWWLPH